MRLIISYSFLHDTIKETRRQEVTLSPDKSNYALVGQGLKSCEKLIYPPGFKPQQFATGFVSVRVYARATRRG